MLKKAFMGTDLGGTGVKAGVFDESGKMLSLSRRSWKPEKNNKGFFEVPAETIIDSAKKTVSEAAKPAGAEISAVSVTSQGQTFISIDKNGKPLHNAILWYDSRAGEQAEELNEKISGASGIEISPICTAAKILWLKQNQPEIEKKTEKHLLLPDLINYMLTGIAATDPNTASSTGFYTYTEENYNKKTLEAAGIPVSRLSEIIPTGQTIGNITRSAAKEWGLKPGTPVISGTNDQYSGALGAGNFRAGILTETTGTCMAAVTLTEKLPSPLPEGLYGGKFPLNGYYFLLTYSKTAGILLDWFTGEFCAGKSIEAMEKQSAKIPPGSRGVLVMPDFDGSVSPLPNPGARGSFHNMTINTSKESIFRAILESLGYSLREQITYLEKTGIKFDTIRSTGGGANSSLWLQIKSDILNSPVEKPLVTESAVLGAAMIAAAGSGFFKTIKEGSKKLYKPGRTFYPVFKTHDIYSKLYKDYCRLKNKLFQYE